MRLIVYLFSRYIYITAICRLCREKLFRNNSIEHVEEKTILRQIQKTRLQKLKYHHQKERGFESSHVRMWQTYNIGEGKLVTLKSTKNSVQLKVLNDWTEMSFNYLITEGTEQTSKQQKQTFFYPMDGCIQEFKNQISLAQHLFQCSCEYKLEKGPLKGQVKVLYTQKLSNNVKCPDMQALLLENACTTDLSAKKMLRAFKVKKKKSFFSINQKEFMTDNFIYLERMQEAAILDSTTLYFPNKKAK